MKLHLGLKWRIFHVLVSEDIDDVISSFFTVVWVNIQFVCIVRRKLHGVQLKQYFSYAIFSQTCIHLAQISCVFVLKSKGVKTTIEQCSLPWICTGRTRNLQAECIPPLEVHLSQNVPRPVLYSNTLLGSLFKD